MKGVERFGSAQQLGMVCTAGDAPGDWRNIRLRGRDMLEAESGWFGFRDARLVLFPSEVRDECSFGDLADGLGYGCCSR